MPLQVGFILPPEDSARNIKKLQQKYRSWHAFQNKEILTFQAIKFTSLKRVMRIPCKKSENRPIFYEVIKKQ